MIPVSRFAAELGILRLGLIGLATLISLFATEPGTVINLSSFVTTLNTLVLPAAAPLVFFVMMFDVLMSSVRLQDAPPSMRSRWRRVLITEMVFVALLLVSWAAFFQAVFSPVNAS